MSESLPLGPAGLPLVMTKVDRYWLPEGDRPIARFFARNLYFPHGLRERCGITARRLISRGGTSLSGKRHLTATLLSEGVESPERGGGGVRKVVAPLIAMDRAYARLERQAARLYGFLDILSPKLPSGKGPLLWILIEDYATDQKMVLLLFRAGDERPVAALKVMVAPPGEVPHLARERDTLASLRETLPSELAATLPEPLGYAEEGGFSALMLSAVSGRPAYVEMQRSWRPRRHLDRHFHGAANWLARFHCATRCAGLRVRIPSSLENLLGSTALGEHDRRWVDRLRTRLANRPIHLAAGHGDFWARNLMFPEDASAGGLAGVVDWEDSRPVIAPIEDLFHFPLTYGRSYPWRGYRQLSAISAFRRTFLEENPLSREVKRYLHLYCRIAEVDPQALPELFQLYVLNRVSEDACNDGAANGEQEAKEPWSEMYRMLSRTDRSVFSG